MLRGLCACGRSKAHSTARGSCSQDVPTVPTMSWASNACLLPARDALRADQRETVLVEAMANVELEAVSKHEGEHMCFNNAEFLACLVSTTLKDQSSSQTWQCSHSSSERLCVKELQRLMKTSSQVFFCVTVNGNQFISMKPSSGQPHVVAEVCASEMGFHRVGASFFSDHGFVGPGTRESLGSIFRLGHQS